MVEEDDLENPTGNRLHSDATTKFHCRYQSFQVTLQKEKQMTIGLTEVGAINSDVLRHLKQQ